MNKQKGIGFSINAIAVENGKPQMEGWVGFRNLLDIHVIKKSLEKYIAVFNLMEQGMEYKAAVYEVFGTNTSEVEMQVETLEGGNYERTK